MNHPRVTFPFLLHGTDYNPDQWPESVWDDDIRLMQEAHVNVATLPVFSWSRLQPQEDVFTFEWLDRVLDKLHDGGISVCLATSTAAHPAWMSQRYPDVLCTPRNGRRQRHGGRQRICPNSENFRRLASALAGRLAERYANHPALLLWHVSNEYVSECYCDTCAARFREWIRARYGSLENLNDRWNLAFWSHSYSDWSQIDPPTEHGEQSIPALTLDYSRFVNESNLGCYLAEKAAIRKFSPDTPITTNLMGHYYPLDYHAWAPHLDIVAWDSYPANSDPHENAAFQHALMRGLKDGAPWLMMESSPSQTNWRSVSPLRPPGMLRLQSFQAIAHGSDAVMYFQWRRSRSGAEKFHGAVVDHVGESRPRIFREVVSLGAELDGLRGRTLGGQIHSRAAILFDWDNWHAIQNSRFPSERLNYPDAVRATYSALARLGIPPDVIPVTANLRRYNLIFAPYLYMLKPGLAERLEAFVSAGGALVTGPLSGMVDQTDHLQPGGFPGPLRQVLGVRVEEFDGLPEPIADRVVFNSPWGSLDGAVSAHTSADVVRPETAVALANYNNVFYSDAAALTVNAFGSGRAYYLATFFDPAVLREILRGVCTEAGVGGLLPGDPPENVEVTERVSPSGDRLLYILNHNTSQVEIDLPAGILTDILTCREHSGRVGLDPYGVLVLEGAKRLSS